MITMRKEFTRDSISIIYFKIHRMKSRKISYPVLFRTTEWIDCGECKTTPTAFSGCGAGDNFETLERNTQHFIVYSGSAKESKFCPKRFYDSRQMEK